MADRGSTIFEPTSSGPFAVRVRGHAVAAGPSIAPATRDPSHPVLRLLGGFHLSTGGRPTGLARGEQRLIALLALREGVVTRRQLAAVLWPGRDGAQAHACLRSSLWRLRREVDVVHEHDEALHLADDVVVDVQVLGAAARLAPRPRSVRSDGPVQPDPFRAIDLSGELLPDWDDAWVLVERERLRQLSLHVLEATVCQLVERGRFLGACDLAHTLIAMDPLRESSHRALIRVHLAEGNHVDALRQARNYRRRLRDEVGLDPSSLLDQLIQGVG